METAVQLFRRDQKLTAIAVKEPLITLVRNDDAFGLLYAECAHEDSYSSCLYFDWATHLCIAGLGCRYIDFLCVSVHVENGIWVAQDCESGLYLPKPSKRPYHVIFISQKELRRLKHSRAEGLAVPVFHYAQQLFGRLPGFSYTPNSLTTPDDYATGRSRSG